MIPAMAAAVLAYWFEGDQQETYRTKWFPPSGSDIQAATDAEITRSFGDLLATAETHGLHASWTAHQDSFVALIVLIDQFSRHIYRHDAAKRQANDVLALELATAFVDAGHHLRVAVPYFVFALMPFRHSPTPDRLTSVLGHIDTREATMLEHTDLLSKFRRTTVQRQSHLRTSTHNADDDAEFDILERAAFLHPDEATLLPKHMLVPVMHQFLTAMRAGSDACPAIGISLSGGVDSMVIAYLLVRLAPRFNNYKVVAVHIDYLNRVESSAEAAYVHQWSQDHGIDCFVRKVNECQRATTKREDYEKLSRDIRYTTYQDIMAKYSIPGMCVGHHRGDVQENVISNMMKGQSLLGLNGMTPLSVVNGVRIWRPLLSVDKDAIFDFAHQFGVPYFKDTTPQWSTRGKLRRRLMPLLQEIYGEGYLNNLSNLGQEATECADVLESALLSPVLDTVQSSGLAVWIDLTLLCAQPMFLWKEILRRVCHGRMGERMIRDKPMLELRAKVLKTNFKASWITLKKSTKSFVTDEKVLILFREPVFQQKHGVDVDLPLDATTTLGNWHIHLCVASPDDPTVLAVQDKRWDMWSVMQTSGVTYVLPHAPRYVIETEDRPVALRGIDKCLTDAMPLVMNQGIFEASDDVVVVTMEYIQHADSNMKLLIKPMTARSMRWTKATTSTSALVGMELHLEQVLDSARHLHQPRRHQSLALSKWKCHSALDALHRQASTDSVDEDDDDGGQRQHRRSKGGSVHSIPTDHMRFHSKLVNCEDDESSSIDDVAVRQHLQRYADRYQGLEAYGQSGLSKLQHLIDTAISVQTKCRAANACGVTLGVAVLSSSGHVFTSSSNDLCLDTCPERLAFMKLASDEVDFVVEGCAISSSDELFAPYPCGSCREFWSQFGDFPIYLIRATMEFERTTAYALFPRGNRMAIPGQHATSPKKLHHAKTKDSLQPRHLVHPHEWLVGHVVDWLIEDVGLPEYAAIFETHEVNGATLRYMEESDLQFLLHIQHPLHRKRIGLCLDRLRDQDAVHYGVEYGQLHDYLAVLDKDRIEVVVQLKQAFDAVDTNHDGQIDFSEIKQALTSLHYDASASAVEAWIQSRSDQSAVTFPEFALAFCHTRTTNTQTLPVPKLDLQSVRTAFDRMDTDGNGSLEKGEVVQALSALGQANSEAQADEWFCQVDADGSNALSFPEFLLRYAQLHCNVAPLQAAFAALDAADAGLMPLAQLPQAFRSLQILYDRSKMDKWMAARPTETLSLPDFVLAYFLFVQAPMPVSGDEETHRHRIVQLQQSGHVRLCTKPNAWTSKTMTSSSRKTASPKKTPARRQTDDDDDDGKDNDDDEGKEGDDDDEENEYVAVHKMFRRFNHARLTALEAIQAITELGVVVPRTQMLEYFTKEGFGTKRDVEYEDLVRAYRHLQVYRPQCVVKHAKDGHKTRMKAIEALLSGKFGTPHTRRDFDERDGKVDDADDDTRISQREWAAEMKTWVSKRRKKHSNDDDHGKGDDDDDERSSRQSSRSPVKYVVHEDADRQRGGRDRQMARRLGRFQVGDRVVDKTRAMGPGTIIRQSGPYQVCTIHFDSGLKRHNVAMASLRRFKDAPLAAFRVVEPFDVDHFVTVLYKGTKTIRHGRVKKVRANDEYDVEYSDGEVEKHVAATHMKRSTKTSLVVDTLEEGMAVEARGKDGPTYYRGKIAKCRPNGTFDVKFKNGADEQRLPRKWIRVIQDKHDEDDDDKYEDDDDDYADEDELTLAWDVGDVVEARFQGGEKYFRGTISKCRPQDGTLDIRYDDGDEEKQVKAAYVRSIHTASSKLAKGDDVEARFGGKDAYFAGTIARVHSDGTVDIDYADGDSETRVAAKLVRKGTTSKWEAGQAVEARFGGQDKFYGGKITRVHGDRTLDITYADGDKETHVDPKLVRATSSTSSHQRKAAESYDDDEFE
ncbi:Aste57867_19547 [Aphanomyces stellatus]|uniref:tRNA(Ile)-lysidine synthetase n=1 Tax=Aphanomyces stellatus TaxID=120398 RepID=A0A485LCY2_9STRA|nr:hypothetical protein As57867_019483 [Aphanomyces stellatus]VFT96253.1 Aste57867_19547 [Aphanomyces stellatus]